MYYRQSRYYDAKICRFISPDAIGYLGANEDLISYNLYAYCDNNPVTRVDYDGEFWGTIFDIVSLVVSVVDVIKNPDDVWAWVGLAGDVVDLLPIVSGVGEATDALRVATKIDNVVDVADGISDTAKVVDNSIDTYKALRKVNAGNDLEVHHIVEKRFNNVVNKNSNEMLSIALTHEEHAVYTCEWRKHLPYGKMYEIDDIWEAAQEIYAKQPRLLEAVKKRYGVNCI